MDDYGFWFFVAGVLTFPTGCLLSVAAWYEAGLQRVEEDHEC